MADMGPDHPLIDDILRRRRMRRIGMGVLIVLILGVAAALYLTTSSPPPEPEPSPSPSPLAPEPTPEPSPVAPSPPAPPPEPSAPPEPKFTPPPLAESDPVVRELAARTTPHAQLKQWLLADGLIRRFVVSVDNLREGKTPRKHLESTWLPDAFTIIEDEDGNARIDPESYARYDLVTDVFVATDPREAASAYRKLQPLFDEVYRGLGYPDGRFDDALTEAIAELLAAPVVVGDPIVVRGVVSWKYEDPGLEDLSAAQKQLLRMGPKNVKRVQRQLRALAQALGISSDRLPSASSYEVEKAS